MRFVLIVSEIGHRIFCSQVIRNLQECVFLCLFCRSPSPEPIYSSDGKRLNTREFRTRKRLEEQRHQLILRMQCMNPEFKPPSDYK